MLCNAKLASSGRMALSEDMGKNPQVNLSSFEPMLSYAANCR